MLDAVFGRKLAARSRSFFSQLEALARESGLIKRSSDKFSAGGFALALCQAVLSGRTTFNQIVMLLAQIEPEPMTPQGLFKRIDQEAVSFWMQVVSRALMERWGDEQVVESALFNRVLVEDSSQAKLHHANHEEFPGHGNDKGQTAGCKFNVGFDLLSGETVAADLHLATAQDRELGKELVDCVEQNDLVLRDMGYFSLGEFARIEAREAWWLSRLPANVKVCDVEGHKLETLLRTAKGEVVEFDAMVGDSRHPARLVAVRATPEVAARRRRERRKEARKNGKSPRRDMLERDGWHIMLTNISEEMMEAGKLFKLYGVRWQIEITFRAWKQSSHFKAAFDRRSNPFHFQSLMYAGMLLLILTMKLAALLQSCCRQSVISIEKVADAVAALIPTLPRLERFGAYNPDLRHLRMSRRKRKSLRQIAIGALG